MSEEESTMKFNDFVNQLSASRELSQQDNPEIVIELPDGECLEISEVTWDKNENVILIQIM